MFKWVRQTKQKRKKKKKIYEIKVNLFFIDRINLLIEKIENFKIKFIKITIYAQDIDLVDYNFENNNKVKFKSKEQAIIFLKNYRRFYEKQITKIKQKYEHLIPLLHESQSNQSEKILPRTDITSTITLKNKNGHVVKISLNDPIESIDSNLFTKESDSTNTNEQAETTSLISYAYYNSAFSQSQQQLNFSITESNKTEMATTKKQDLISKINKLTI